MGGLILIAIIVLAVWASIATGTFSILSIYISGKGRSAAIARVVLSLVSPLLLVAAGLLSLALYYKWVPIYFASNRIVERDTTVRLEFFASLDALDPRDASGKYLTATSPRGSVTYNMESYDWIHHARTSVYLVDNNRLAILGPNEDQILIDENLKISGTANMPSQNWTYVGAFDFVQPEVGKSERWLRFIPPTLHDECVPGVEAGASHLMRNDARRRTCPTLQSKD